MSALSISGLAKSFGATVALKPLELQIAEGEFVVLLGPSGCGKTTALRALTGLDLPDHGRIRIGAREVFNAASGIDIPANKRDIGMVFQSYALWPHLSVAQNVAYPLQARGIAKTEIGPRLVKALRFVGLEDYAERLPQALSGGQQQRVALARALVADPALVLYDEPLSNLDAQLRQRLREDLRAMHQARPRTSIYVTHDQAEALTLADRIVLLRGGEIAQQGTADELFLAPNSRFVAEFVGMRNFLQGQVLGFRAIAGSSRVLIDWKADALPQSITLEHPHPLPIGTPVTAAFRSSAVRIDPDGLPARMTSISYGGERFEARFAIGAESISAALDIRQGRELARQGDGLVPLRIEPSEITLFIEPSDAATRRAA